MAEHRPDSGGSGSPVSRGTGIRPRGVVVSAALGFALCVVAGWIVLGTETDATEDPLALSDRPVAATDDELLHQATERLIAQCMDRHGFEYAEQSPSSSESTLPRVLDDVEWARENGYGDLFGARGVPAPDANSRILAAMTSEQQNAWNTTLMGTGHRLVVNLPDRGRLSTSNNGCTAEAQRTLYGDLAGWYHARRAVDHLGSYVNDEVIANPEYRTGLASWVRCVRERGLVASNPTQLRQLVAPESTGGRAHPKEIAAAVAEAACGSSTGFAATSAALERTFRPKIERRFAPELDALKSFKHKALPRARQVLARS